MEGENKLNMKKLVALGVGDGHGKNFVYGDYESIKLLQKKLLDGETAIRNMRHRIDMAQHRIQELEEKIVDQEDDEMIDEIIRGAHRRIKKM